MGKYVERGKAEPHIVAKDDPLAISLEPFERQFLDFGHAVQTGGRPLVAGEDGLAALALVDGIYRSCRSGQPVDLTEGGGQ